MSDIEQALKRLRDDLEATQFPLHLDDAGEAAAMARSAVQQIDDYVLPRLVNLEAPLLVIVGGPTGAGKSTLVNTLIGSPVSMASAIRPTTRQPVLLTAIKDAPWFADNRILPGLIRQTSNAADLSASSGTALRVIPSPQVPEGIAILDAPDIDSVETDNRVLSRQLLQAGDLWLFVTTANRYADAAGWDLLDQAASRSMTVGIVLNRVPPGGGAEIVADLQSLLGSRSLGSSPIFVLEETTVDAQGLLPSIETVEAWLGSIADDRDRRLSIAKRTVNGAISSLEHSARAIAVARSHQEDTANDYFDLIRGNYSQAVKNVLVVATNGTLMRGEVLERWQDFLGTSDVFRTFESWFSGFRDRVSGWFAAGPSPISEVEVEIENGLVSVIIDQAGQCSLETWNRLRTTVAGKELFCDQRLMFASKTIQQDAAVTVRKWQQDLLDLIREQTPKKRRKARIMSLSLNTVTVALMVTVFASTGGLLGGEIAIASGSAVLGQKILETLFGDQAVRKLTDQAATLLEGRIQELFDGEARRYLDELEVVRSGTSWSKLRSAIDQLEEVRL